MDRFDEFWACLFVCLFVLLEGIVKMSLYNEIPWLLLHSFLNKYNVSLLYHPSNPRGRITEKKRRRK
jgi:hypothetical protein